MDRKDLIEYLKTKLPDYLAELGLPVDGSLFKCLNPAHVHKSGTGSMGYHPKKNMLTCFGYCAISQGKKHAHYDIFDVVGWDQGLTEFNEKLLYLAEKYGCSAEAERKPFLFTGNEVLEKSGLVKNVDDKNVPLKNRTSLINAALLNIGNASLYLESRGIDGKLAEKHFIGVLRNHDIRGKKYDVLVLPCDRYHLVLRNIGKNVSAFRYEKRGPATVFNAEAAFEAFSRGIPLFIVEGELDALSVETAGGTALALGSVSNIPLLWPILKVAEKHAGRKSVVILACDNDEAGSKANGVLRDKLKEHGYECCWIDLYCNFKDANEALQNIRDEFVTMVQELQTQEGLQGQLFRIQNCSVPVVEKLGNQEGVVKKIPTGIASLDDMLGGGLRKSWLYVLGAMSGMGKTTLALQVADNLAQTGYDVLYISLEMSSMDLSAKSVSRRMRIASASIPDMGDQYCLDSDGILSFVIGKENNNPETESLFIDAKQQQRRIAKRLFIRNARWGVSDIEKDIAEFQKSGISPVLFIDYLQQLKSSNARSSDKQNVDSDISRIKEIAMKFNIPVIVISSLNRLAYYKPVTVDAFKESGSIEYSADCLLALQMYGVGSDDTRTTVQFQIDMGKYPRITELILLKERNRPCYSKIKLDYYTKFNYFTDHNNKMDSIENGLAFKEAVL